MNILITPDTPLKVTGFGACAWVHSNTKVKLHPPLPDHVDLVEEHLEQRTKHNAHHVVLRRHPERDREHEELVRVELPTRYLEPLLNGKDYILLPKD